MPSFANVSCMDQLAIDLSGDGLVDIYDLSLLASNWLYISCHSNNWCDMADINMDDVVDLCDFDLLSDSWKKEDYNIQ